MSLSNGAFAYDAPFRISLDSPEIIERTSESVRVLDGTSLGLLALYDYNRAFPTIHVTPPTHVADRVVVTHCARIAWLALFGANVGCQDQETSNAGPPTIEVLLPSPHQPLTLPSSRGGVYQLFALAAEQGALPPFPRIPCHTKTSFGIVAHPLRPPKPQVGQNYSRWIPHLNAFFALRALSSSPDDLDLLHDWLNSPRVDEFWGEASDDLHVHRRFIAGKIDDPHTEPVIGSYVDPQGGVKPAIFAEIYWGKEDRLAEFYDADDYDRGIHVLVGSEAHRGSRFLRAWLPSLVHYLFLSDPRTQRVVVEPNLLNERMLSIFAHFAGMRDIKHFDFPHKRAALMMVTREEFFEGNYL